MKNLIICIGHCGANIVNDIADKSRLSDFKIIYMDESTTSLDELVSSHQDNVYIYCGLGGNMAHKHLSEVTGVCRPFTTNLLCFCTFPFRYEGGMYCNRAKQALAKIPLTADITVVQYNDRLQGDDNLSMMNNPIVSAAVATISQCHRALIHTVSAILETTGIHTSLKANISTDYLDIFINKTRLKNLVNEALGVHACIPSPDGVSKTMQSIWDVHQSGNKVDSKIYEILLPPAKSDKQ